MRRELLGHLGVDDCTNNEWPGFFSYIRERRRRSPMEGEGTSCISNK